MVYSVLTTVLLIGALVAGGAWLLLLLSPYLKNPAARFLSVCPVGRVLLISLFCVCAYCAQKTGTEPLDPDTDGDLLPDGWEVLKGMATTAGTSAGGWGFNVWSERDDAFGEDRLVRYSPAGAQAALANGTVTSKPVFDVSGASELMDSDASEDDVFLALAKHVPALSSPVGAIRIWNMPGKDVDMNLDAEGDGIPRPNGWGRAEESLNGLNWLHSDMKDMAYFYVYKLYEEIVLKGDLK